MNDYQEPARKIPVMGHYDIIVVGGGCAGFAAAVASARNGAKTIILERFPYFGGTATASLMANIVGIRNQVEPNDLQVCKGIGEELLLKLIERGEACVTKHHYQAAGKKHTDTKGDLSYSYAFSTEGFKLASLEMVEESGCDILFHVFFSDVIMEENTVKGVIVETKGGRAAIMGKVIIDASGDGDVAARAGVPFWQTRGTEKKRLHDTLMFKVGGFDPDHITVGSCVFEDSMVLWGPLAEGGDATDPWQLTEMERSLRKKVYEHFAMKQAQYPELKNAHITDTGSLMGIRQTRFIEGEYKITGDDVLEGRRFDDVIALAANPVISYYGYRRFLEHEGYDIPYRCLVPQKVDGLLVAGRCMSSDQIAFESWRAMANVLCIGEAAGTAAALCVKADVQPRNADVRKLQEQLKAQGAEIGQGRTRS